ncbi:MAG: iron chelate uptake ABC transporter family permease subunit [Myxococcota bacterium]
MDVSWMIAPAAACLIVAVALGWFGLHVLQRGVIFVDLALAQVAALGTTYAVFLGHEPDEPIAYVLGLVFTVFGAIAFSLARRFESRVPQEAIIGIAYAVSAGAGSMMLDFASDPHGAEKLQHLMVGNVVWVTWPEIGALAGVCAVVLGLHAAVSRTLLRISFDPHGAESDGLRVAVWDMAFYLTFGLVITTVVHVAGVLLIFSYLIVPAVIARLFVDGVVQRLLVAWAVAIPVSLLGVGVSYEHAAGPIIVVMLAGCLLAALIGWGIRNAASPARAAVGVAGAGLVVAGVLAAISLFEGGEHHHDHVEDPAEHAAHAADAHPGHDSQVDAPPADPGARDGWYRAHAGDLDLLAAAASAEADPSLVLLSGAILARSGRTEGLVALARVAASEVPFLRLEADGMLRAAAGDAAPTWEPLAGPEPGGWAAWAAAPTAGWADRARAIAVP